MKATESGVGLVSCACWDQHATIGWKKSGFLMVSLVTFCFLGLFVPYIVIIARDMMPAFLPFISQSGGEPPTNGLFAIFMDIGLFFGAFAFLLLYVSVNHRNTKNFKFITYAAKIIAVFMVVAWLGLIMTVSFPVGYTDVPNKFQWVMTVLLEHGFSATLIIVGLATMQYLIAGIWWYLPDISKTERYSKMVFPGIYILFFLMIIYPLPKYLLEEIGPNPFDLESMKNVRYALPTKYSIAYMFCSFCEWGLILLSIINLTTLYKDLQRVSCRFVFRHKSCQAEEEEPVPSISLRIIT